MTRRYISTALILSLILITIRLDSYAGSFSRNEIIGALAGIFNFIGNGAFIGIACLGISASGFILKNERLRDAGSWSILAFIIISILVQVLKASFERPRIAYADSAVLNLLNHPALFDLSGRYDSFPSGHTTASFTVAYTLSYFYPGLRLALFSIATLVGLSRIYIGAHYPSDVFAGALIGIYFGIIMMNGVLRRRYKEILLSIVVVLICFFKLGGFFLFDVDEAVFSEAAREMIAAGNYLTPLFNYLPRYDKPILFYWLMAIPYKLFGISEFSARFWSAGLGVALVAATFFFVRKIKGVKAATWASICLLVNLEFFVYTHSAVTDMALTFFIASASYCFYIGLKREEWAYHTGKNSFRQGKWFLVFWLSSGLAVLTKGIIGVLFPVAISSLYLLATKDLGGIRRFFKPLHIILFFIVTAPWFAVQLYINGWEFYNSFIIKHHILRYTEVISGHSGPIYYYVGVLVLGFFPWISFLPGAFSRCLKEKGVYLFCAIWFLFVFIFFSISRTKLPNYILPLFPAAAIMTGIYISEASAEKLKMPFYVLAVISLAISVLLFIIPHLDIALEIHYRKYFIYLIGLIFLSISVFSIMIRFHRQMAFGGIVFLTAFLLISLRTYGLPPLNIYLQKTLYLYARYSKNVLGTNGILATYEINKPSILFYSGREIKRIESWNIGEFKRLMKRGRLIVITKNRYVERLAQIAGIVLLDTDGRYAILSNRKDMPKIGYQ